MTQKKTDDDTRTSLPPGCTPLEVEYDTHLHYRCPVLGFSISMELRRCSFHDRRYRLASHIQKGQHIFNLPRKLDKEFPPSFVINNKIESKEQLQMVIMRALSILAGSLNISNQKAVN